MLDLSLSDEQQAIVDSASSLLKKLSPVARLRPSGSHFDAHPAIAEWGWFGIAASRDQGGAGLGLVEEALLYLEAGRVLLSPSALATTLAVRAVSGALQSQLLNGQRRAALVISGADDITYCFDRHPSDVLVMIDDVVSVLDGNSFKGEPVLGLDDAVSMEKGRLVKVARLGEGPRIQAVLLVSAMLAGIAAEAGAKAVDYAKNREQFGQPIGAFQAIKHQCADMAVKSYLAEAQVLLAALSASEGASSSDFQSAAAARTAISAARANSTAALHVFGGLGFTAECDAHLYVKRSHLLAEAIGGLDRQHAAILACNLPDRG